MRLVYHRGSVAFILIFIFILLAIVVAILFLLGRNLINLPFDFAGSTKTQIRGSYVNPFSDSEQYSNPFAGYEKEQYVNPFEKLK